MQIKKQKKTVFLIFFCMSNKCQKKCFKKENRPCRFGNSSKGFVVGGIHKKSYQQKISS